MRILFLTQYYPPEPVHFQPDFVRVMRERGHTVTVMTGFPCYPVGKIYDGYRQRIVLDEYVDGVHIVRLPQLPDHSRSAVRRMAYYASFMLSAMTIGNFRFDKCDAVVVYQSAILTGLAGTVLARLHGVPVIYYTVDLWPESVTSSGMLKNRFALSMLDWLCRMTYRNADRVIGITKGYVRRFIEMGVKPEKTGLVYFWSPEIERKLPEAMDIERLIPREGKFCVVYTGNMGPAQNIGNVLDTAKLLQEDAGDIEFFMVGDGLDFASLKQRVEREKIHNVRFVGRFPPFTIPLILERADALLVHLKSDELTKVSIPSKTQAYMQAGKPVIMAVAGEAGEFVKEHGFGVSVDPTNPKVLAEAVRAVYKMSPEKREELGQRGKKAFEELCSSKVQGAKLCEIIEDAVKTRAGH